MSRWSPTRVIVVVGLLTIAGVDVVSGRPLAALVQGGLAAGVALAGPPSAAPPTTRSVYDKIYQLYALASVFLLLTLTGPASAVGTVAGLVATCGAVALASIMLVGIRRQS